MLELQNLSKVYSYKIFSKKEKGEEREEKGEEREEKGRRGEGDLLTIIIMQQ